MTFEYDSAKYNVRKRRLKGEKEFIQEIWLVPK